MGLIGGPILRSGGVISSSAADGAKMLLWNGIGAGAIIAWNAACSLLIFFTLKKTGLLRVCRNIDL